MKFSFETLLNAGGSRLTYGLLNLRILGWILYGFTKPGILIPSQILAQIIRIGVQAIPMASLVSLSVGFILAMESSTELGKMGADSFIPDLVSLSLMRELGPLLVAIIVVGRSGSAVAAELGTMKVNEEIEALRVMAIDPIRYLVVPRFIALMIMLPCMTILGTCIGLVGGWAVCTIELGMPSSFYIFRAIQRPELWDLYSGIIKTAVFAHILITIACYQGLNVEGGAEGVGRATTSAVVYSILWIIIADAILTGLFFFAL
ncbi:MAG: ABC transporter permease [Verrucomicrobia bacterium]|nr:ABC transporter permease [Verrucomicrobiota bacterium]MDA0858696.1 ABC transporter permease [Verrucomicrobiota bacterium]MDA1340017.1 ABC transporter permease [Verrucomicrobiota bacterium]